MCGEVMTALEILRYADHKVLTEMGTQTHRETERQGDRETERPFPTVPWRG